MDGLVWSAIFSRKFLLDSQLFIFLGYGADHEEGVIG